MTTSSTLSRSFPTFKYAAAPIRWLLASRRRVWLAAGTLLAILAAPVAWWSLQLAGLPDIGEPFEKTGSRPVAAPDDRNPFVLYLEAAARLKTLKALRDPSGEPIDPHARWAEADPRLRRWVEENREVLAIYRAAAERSEPAPISDEDEFKLWQALNDFDHLAMLEGSRLEDQGDMAGAWSWYRAVLRSSHHEGAYGGIIKRSMAQQWRFWLSFRLTAWAGDRRTTSAMLRRALDDALACGLIRPSESYTLEFQYRLLRRQLDNQGSPAREVNARRWKATFGIPDYYLSPDQMQAVYDAWRFSRREPERSRRVLRLAVANWRAYYERPPDRRPEPEAKVSGKYDFYTFGPEAPASARALVPEALDRWLATTIDAQEWLIGLDWRQLRNQERAQHRAIVILLASQLYRRDHRTDPPSEEALVGPYLKSLPDDGSTDAADRPVRRADGAVQ